MILALTYVGISTVVLTVLTFVYVIEDRKERRIVLEGFRSWLDKLFTKLLKKLAAVRAFFTHGFVRLLLHYSAHKILKRILATLQRLEKKVEELVRRNRTVAKTIKASKEKNHLHAIAEHKEEVALSDKEKEERLSR
jgi:hypothetical protein